MMSTTDRKLLAQYNSGRCDHCRQRIRVGQPIVLPAGRARRYVHQACYQAWCEAELDRAEQEARLSTQLDRTVQLLRDNPWLN